MSRRLLIEADGGARGNPGPAAYGAIVVDAESGELLVELAGHLGVATNNVAEYSGLVAALEAVRGIDPQASVDVRMDSKLVVEQMSGRWKIKHSDMQRLARLAHELEPSGGVHYTWIPREKNKAADALANESMDDVERGGSGHIERWRTHADSPLSESAAGSPRSHQGTLEETAPARPAVVGWGPDLGDPLVLTVLRHGVTAGTVQRRFSGVGGEDHPLTELGHAQVNAAAAEIVKRGNVDAVVCSPLLRARQTADAVAAVTGLTPVVVNGFAECAFGEWDGLTFGEVAERWPNLMARWLSDPHVSPPGGESLAQLYDRVSAALDDLRASYHGKHVVAVGHVGTVRALTARVLSAPLLAMNRMELLPASLTTLTWYADGNSSLRGYGEAPYLRDL